jgi:hypothetical protein
MIMQQNVLSSFQFIKVFHVLHTPPESHSKMYYGKGGSPGRRVASATVNILTSGVCTVRVVSPVYALVSDETCAIS